jgi:hypothetical protein
MSTLSIKQRSNAQNNDIQHSDTRHNENQYSNAQHMGFSDTLSITITVMLCYAERNV